MVWRVVFLLGLVLACACGTPGPTEPQGGVGQCEDAASCEKSIVAAKAEDVGGLVETYAKVSGDDGWTTAWQALRAAPERPAAVNLKAPAGVDAVAMPAAQAVPVESLVLALGRAAGRTHLFVARPKDVVQVFPGDVLEPFAVGLPPVLLADAARLEQEVGLAARTRAAVLAARARDYVKAAAEVDALRALAHDGPYGGLRAEVAERLFEAAGIALGEEPQSGEAPPPASTEAPRVFPDAGTAYGDLLVLELAPAGGEWPKRLPRLRAALDAPRLASVERRYGPASACPEAAIPPMERVGDLLFAAELVGTLDPLAGPGDPPLPGRLELGDWLPRYERAVGLVDEAHAGWVLGPTLLAQRGEAYGLSAAGTTTYARVSQMGLDHLDALGDLAAAAPARFQTMPLATMAHLPGILGDQRMFEALQRTLAGAITHMIEGAPDADALWSAALVAFGSGLSVEGPIQLALFAALEEGLAKKLAGPFGQAGGWGVAGLFAGHALLRGLGAGFAEARPPIVGVSRALAKDGLSYPSVARLVQAAARYVELGASQGLDAATSNPRLYSPERKAAREALRAAVGDLDAGGPQTPDERDLADQLVEMADGLVAVATALLTREGAPAACTEKHTAAGDEKLRSALDRLQKARRALVVLPAFKKNLSGEGVWTRRARVIGLVLSDALDLADREHGDIAFRVAAPDAERIAREGLRGWAESAAAELASSSYLLVRTALEEGGSPRVSTHALRVLAALADLFGRDGGGALFAAVARAGAESVAGDDVGTVLTRHAAAAYERGAVEEGDLLLMANQAVALVRQESVDPAAIELAKVRARPVELALALWGPQNRDGGDPAGLLDAMQRATAAGCHAPSATAIIAVRKALHDFQSGKRDAARESLERVLAAAEKDGLVLPRQSYVYQQVSGQKVVNVSESLSLASPLLKGAGSFQVGLGLQSRSLETGSFYVSFTDPNTADAWRESARFYAHVAAILATYHFLAGDDVRGMRAATRAVGAWVSGARLGHQRVPVETETSRWAGDAAGTLAVLAELAAERDHAFLAGDLWTLAGAGVDAEADDTAVGEVLDPPPFALRGIPELDPVLGRARRALAIVAGRLPCTQEDGEPEVFDHPDCAGYAAALGLRVADALPKLPRLKGGAEAKDPSCRAWRALDGFLAAADEQRYEPDKLVAAVEALRQTGRHHDAAVLLARQRHPQHCSPALTAHARALAEREELGIHLRADMLTVAVGCGQGEDIAADLGRLDDLTQHQAVAVRNLEVILFAARLGLQQDQWQALLAITKKPGFVRRWQEVGAELAAAALLMQHAAALGAGEPVDMSATLPYYRLLCTTFPAGNRGSTCNALSLLRGDATVAAKKEAARAALTAFMERVAGGS